MVRRTVPEELLLSPEQRSALDRVRESMPGREDATLGPDAGWVGDGGWWFDRGDSGGGRGGDGD